MELNHDWRSFQSAFYPHRRAGQPQPEAATGAVNVIIEDGPGDDVDSAVIIAAYADGEDLSEWVGARLKDARAVAQHRPVRAFRRAEADRVLQQAAGLAHLYEQVELFRSGSVPVALPRPGGWLAGKRAFRLDKRQAPGLPDANCRRHFLVEALTGWWTKVLPSAYGLFIRVEGRIDGAGGSAEERDFFLVVRRGSLEGFHEPDLASLGPERRRQPADVVKYLSEKHLVPVQGIFVTAAEWNEWSQSPHPWAQVMRSMRAGRARLVPFRWGPATLMTARALFGI